MGDKTRLNRKGVLVTNNTRSALGKQRDTSHLQFKRWKDWG